MCIRDRRSSSSAPARPFRRQIRSLRGKPHRAHPWELRGPTLRSPWGLRSSSSENVKRLLSFY
eukprot:9205870-Alexandrium_andersonii.AAC.1